MESNMEIEDNEQNLINEQLDNVTFGPFMLSEFDHPTFCQFLEMIYQGDPKVIEFFKELRCLEQCVRVNGKTDEAIAFHAKKNDAIWKQSLEEFLHQEKLSEQVQFFREDFHLNELLKQVEINRKNEQMQMEEMLKAPETSPVGHN